MNYWLTEIEGRPATLIDADFFGVALRTEMEVRRFLYKNLVPPRWSELVNTFEFDDSRNRRFGPMRLTAGATHSGSEEPPPEA